MKNQNLRSNPNGHTNEIGSRHSSHSEAEDLRIIAQLQAGNHDALTTLFEKYSGMVFGIARRILHDDAEAEEVVQQVFLDTYRAINQYDERKGSVKTWLFQYCYHRTLTRKKHLEVKGFYSTDGLEDQEPPETRAVSYTMEALEGPSRRIKFYSHEVGQLVEQLLSSIQPRQRVAIELTFFEGLTAEEIASKTGESATVVRHNLYRGLSKLRSALTRADKHSAKSARNEIEGVLFGDPARSL